MDFIHGTAFFLSTRFSRGGPEKEVGELSALLIDIRLHAVYGKITVAVTEGAIGQKNKENGRSSRMPRTMSAASYGYHPVSIYL